MAQWEPMIRSVAHEMLDGLAGRGEVECVTDFANPYTMRIIAEILGLDAADVPNMERWARDFNLDPRSIDLPEIRLTTPSTASALAQNAQPVSVAMDSPMDAHPPVIPGYTGEVKTAISVPDDTYERVSKRARELGMSRSELFSRAAARYLDELDAESVTRQIDLAVASLGPRDDSAADAVAAGHRMLAATTDEW